MLYDPDTQTLHRNQSEAKKLGLPRVQNAPQPETALNERAVLDDLPTQQPDGTWQRGWTVETVTPTNALVNRERRRRLVAGSAFTVTGMSNPILLQGRDFDMTIYLGLLAQAQAHKAAGITSAVMQLRDADNATHALTPDQMISLITQAMQWVEGIMQTSWDMKDNGIPADFTADARWT